jgi:signal transduction histidine kinase
MKAALGGSRMPDDASVPVQILYWALTPLRLYRQRTSVQLMVSYVAMALITALLLVIGVVTAVWWPQVSEMFGIEDVALDFTLGEQARSYAWWLDPDALAVSIEEGMPPDDRAALNSRLDAIVDAQAPGFDPPLSDDHAFRIAHVAILDMNGRIIASDDPAWAEVGGMIPDFPHGATRTVAARTLVLGGDPDPAWGALYSLEVEDERTSASFPLITRDGEMIGAIVLEGNPIRAVIGGDTRFGLVRYFLDQLRYVMLLILIPAIVVAIPFGLWRSRSISQRLERMASAADAMAEGELDTRLPVKQRDEIGRVAERFNEMASTIANTERMRQAFISNVSHELRTPISIIQGTVERQLEGQVRPDPASAASLHVIQREADMLDRMIADLFTLTRLRENSLRLERKAFDFSELASLTVGGISNVAWTQSRVSVESLVPPDLPLVYGDETRIRQVLNNLLYNSLRHTPEGGLVVIQAQPVGQMVEVAVSDTGVGIPDDEVEHVFDRYYQAERGARHDDGSGLGLTIVQQLVRAHGGDISVETRRGEGTTFRFTLPQAT